MPACEHMCVCGHTWWSESPDESCPKCNPVDRLSATERPPETIYLIPGEYEGEHGLVWCEDPAPDEHCDPAEAVEYVRVDSVAHLKVDALVRQRNWAYKLNHHFYAKMVERSYQIERARQIITDLVEYAEQNDPGCPHIGRAKGFLSGGES